MLHRSPKDYDRARAERHRRAVIAGRQGRAASRELRAIAHDRPTAADAVAVYDMLALVTM